MLSSIPVGGGPQLSCLVASLTSVALTGKSLNEIRRFRKICFEINAFRMIDYGGQKRLPVTWLQRIYKWTKYPNAALILLDLNIGKNI